MSRLEITPLEHIQWRDLQALKGTAESLTLEFKADLSSKKGGRHPWHDGGHIDPHARDKIAAEIVAFANSWGGTLVLGAVEAGTPRVCTELNPLPRVSELAQQLDDALSGVIEPPLPSMACHAVATPDGNNTGVVLIRVPRSALAPHGFGAPAESYVRRGTRADPMSMSDIQNSFWDSRTRAERITEKRKGADRYLHKRVMNDPEMLRVNPAGGVFARYSAYPHDNLGIQFDTTEMWAKLLRPTEKHAYNGEVSAPFGAGVIDWRPEPVAHGIRNFSRGSRSSALWQLGEDGSVDVWGLCASKPTDTGIQVVWPQWFVTTLGQILIIAEHLRRKARKPGVPYEIDCSFSGFNCQSTSRRAAFEPTGRDLHREDLIDCGPFLFSRSSQAQALFVAMERAVWHGFGIANVEAQGFVFDRGLEALEGDMMRSGVEL